MKEMAVSAVVGGWRETVQKMTSIGRCSFLALAASLGLTIVVAHPGDWLRQNLQSNESKATIEGLVRDIACPIQNLEATATHFNMKCLQECVRGGSPLVILSKDGELYLPISDKMPDTDQRQTLAPFVGKYVRASGTIFDRKGTHAMVITHIDEIKDMRLTIE